MNVRVMCAPGCHFTIAPHPSGLPGLPPLVVHGGETAPVSEARAAALWRAGLICHPVTGELPPPPVAAREGVTVTGPARPTTVTSDGNTAFHLWDAADAEPPVSTEPNRPPRPEPGLQPVSPAVAVQTFNHAMSSPVRITGPGVGPTY